MILMKVGFGATILINGYKFSSGSSMASIPYVQDKKKHQPNGWCFFLDTWVLRMLICLRQNARTAQKRRPTVWGPGISNSEK